MKGLYLRHPIDKNSLPALSSYSHCKHERCNAVLHSPDDSLCTHTYHVPPFVFIGQGCYTLMFLLSSEIADNSRSRARTRCGKTGAFKSYDLKLRRDFVAHGCLCKGRTRPLIFCQSSLYQESNCDVGRDKFTTFPKVDLSMTKMIAFFCKNYKYHIINNMWKLRNNFWNMHFPLFKFYILNFKFYILQSYSTIEASKSNEQHTEYYYNRNHYLTVARLNFLNT